MKGSEIVEFVNGVLPESILREKNGYITQLNNINI